MKKVKNFLRNVVQWIFALRTSFVSQDRLMFLPHCGMVENDGYSIANWKSDNALTLARYILDNNLRKDKIITIGVSANSDTGWLNRYVKVNFPNRRIEFVKALGDVTRNDLWKFRRMLTQCSHVFSSITYPLRPFSSKKECVYVDLGYFPMPFKNDIFPKDNPLYMELDKFDRRDLDYYICNSELASRLIMPSMSLDLSRFLNLGNCRNDYLISDEYPAKVRQTIEGHIDYKVNKIVLYTPTHRDYEQNLQSGASRQLLGYEMDLGAFGAELRDAGIVIVCKLHPKQNRKVIERELPDSIIIHDANHEYGLSELMKASDALLTDYTSGYYDYLLLDKPVVFNFYDVDVYKKSRGFTFDPIESICAGEIVKTPSALTKALLSLDGNAEKYREMRHFVRNLVFSYNDTNSTRRIYERFLGNK